MHMRIVEHNNIKIFQVVSLAIVAELNKESLFREPIERARMMAE